MTEKELPGQDDRQIVAEVLHGRKASFTLLVNRYQRLVRVAIWNYFRKIEIVDDLAQETFLKVYSNLSSLKDPQKIKAWIVQIAFHICVDFQRRNRMENVPFESEKMNELQAPEQGQKNILLDDKMVLSLLERLAPVDCFIVWLRCVEELPYAEIAGITGLMEAGIRQKVSRAMKTLREYVT